MTYALKDADAVHALDAVSLEIGAGEAVGILGESDAYDAMVSHRCYEKGLPHTEAIARLIASKGTQFDPEVVQAFVPIRSRKPPMYLPQQEPARQRSCRDQGDSYLVCQD